jgi:hypothetical protein
MGHGIPMYRTGSFTEFARSPMGLSMEEATGYSISILGKYGKVRHSCQKEGRWKHGANTRPYMQSPRRKLEQDIRNVPFSHSHVS